MSESDQRKHLFAHLALVLAAFVFGTTFVTVKDAVELVDPMPFIGARFCVAAIALAPVLLLRARARRRALVYIRPVNVETCTLHSPRFELLRDGGLAGLALIAGYVLQTVGLQHTSGSVSAFITYLLVVFVPLLKIAHTRRPPATAVAMGVILATSGLFLLTGARGGIGKGEVLTVGCALAFAFHILILERVAPRHDALTLTLVQLSVVGIGCLVPGAFTGGYAFPRAAWLAVLYTAFAASALGFLLQTWAQGRVDPTRTALLLMLEPVFAALLGAVIAGDVLGWRGAAGAALIVGGILVSELGPLRSQRVAAARFVEESAR